MESKAPPAKDSCFRRAGEPESGDYCPIRQVRKWRLKEATLFCLCVLFNIVIFFSCYFILLFICLPFPFEGVMVVCVLHECLYTLAFACTFGGPEVDVRWQTLLLSPLRFWGRVSSWCRSLSFWLDGLASKYLPIFVSSHLVLRLGKNTTAWLDVCVRDPNLGLMFVQQTLYSLSHLASLFFFFFLSRVSCISS